MIYFEEVQETKNKLVSKECDKCHKIYKNVKDDLYEIQEFLHVRFTGGYGSILGDGANIESDLCQNCVKEVLGPYLRIGPDWIDKEIDNCKKE